MRTYSVSCHKHSIFYYLSTELYVNNTLSFLIALCFNHAPKALIYRMVSMNSSLGARFRILTEYHCYEIRFLYKTMRLFIKYCCLYKPWEVFSSLWLVPEHEISTALLWKWPPRMVEMHILSRLEGRNMNILRHLLPLCHPTCTHIHHLSSDKK